MANVTDTSQVPDRIEHFPVSFFGMPMGLFGLTLALRAGGWPVASAAAGWVALAVFIGLGGLYTAKALRHPAALAAEWNHPVRLAFFPAISISVLLLATVLREAVPGPAEIIWVIGAAAQGVLSLAVVASWISHRAFGSGQLSPAWFIPAVGNVIVPLAGVPLGYGEISWYFFSVGLIFWLILLTLVFNRLIFHDPLPGKLRPTLVILIAPPAVAFLAWLQSNGGQIDAAARIMLNAAFFFTLLVAIQLPALLRLPFALSFWALSFPLAAVTTASFRFAEEANSAVHNAIGQVLLLILVVTIVSLLFRTARAAKAREICQPEG
ncbi:SLAC1 anion channel family protein [Pukyongiella litopenaei]|uniref:C4-dicarboxylate ABC transporter n=1 Tax=Pukyongiella litopenaei TaxID=2605946 RepID=A0A2S0MR68_9RHOB|nr:SLAC1 anion channel family protein [Pukyongiella litopenaei]AVO38251.1 C4-dicarboxylate ABC transporter [Pukyongiella litopenaei]